LERRKADPQGSQDQDQLFIEEGRLPVQAIPEGRQFDVEVGGFEQLRDTDSLPSHFGANLVRYARSSEAFVVSAVLAFHMRNAITYVNAAARTFAAITYVSYDCCMATGTKAAPGVLSEALAEILRAQIARKRLLQSEIAEAAHMSQGQLSGVLNAKKHIDVEKLDQLCWVLGLDFWKVVHEADQEVTDRQISKEWTTRSLVQD
jgi:predicted XRE-type DNA-binding protein